MRKLKHYTSFTELKKMVTGTDKKLPTKSSHDSAFKDFIMLLRKNADSNSRHLGKQNK